MDAITQCIEALIVGSPQVVEQLVMIPLARGTVQPRTYKVLEEAISDETASVSEVSESGAVPTLLFENKAPQPVLLIDGDTLMGAKQNRTLNISILIAAGTRTEIPVSCVEAGRWSRTSRHFSPSSDHMYASGRSRMMHDVHRSMEAGHGPRADQHEVWGDIDRKMGRMGVRSATRTMTDIYEQRGCSLDAMAGQLKAAPDQVGAIFIVRDRIAGLELFDHPRDAGAQAAQARAELRPRCDRRIGHARAELDPDQRGVPAGHRPRAAQRRSPPSAWACIPGSRARG